MSEPSAVACNETEIFTEIKYKKALKRLSRLEKQNAFLIDELVKSRQTLMQMKLERDVILDRVADSMVIEDYDFDTDEEDEDISEDNEEANAPISAVLKRKRELIDELVEKAEEDETFSRVLSELFGYQPVVPEQRKKPVTTVTSANISQATAGSTKKRSRPATSGARFNRLSPLTQAMRTGIISDDEGTAATLGNQTIPAPQDSDDFGFEVDEDEGEEAELSQLKKVRSTTSGTQVSSSLLGTPIKEEPALKVIQVPYDAEGKPVLPLSLNMITVHQLGEIVYDRPAYHNKRYILPVGFTTSRSYLSVTSPEASMNYFSKILDNGPAPLFQVTPEGHPEMAFQSTSTTGAWTAVAKAAAAIRGKDTAPSVSGPDYFGLANPTVSMLIEKLPNADKCETYAPKKYEVSNLVGGKTVKNAAQAVNVEIDKAELDINM